MSMYACTCGVYELCWNKCKLNEKYKGPLVMFVKKKYIANKKLTPRRLKKGIKKAKTPIFSWVVYHINSYSWVAIFM